MFNIGLPLASPDSAFIDISLSKTDDCVHCTPRLPRLVDHEPAMERFRDEDDNQVFVGGVAVGEGHVFSLHLLHCA